MNKKIYVHSMEDYIHEKKKEIEELDQSIAAIEDKMAALEKISFLNDYLSILETHLSQLQNISQDLAFYAEQLTKKVGTIQHNWNHDDVITVENITFSISYFKNSYTFFAPVGYDDYYGMDIYVLFSYNSEQSACEPEMIGYTDKPKILLQNPLKVIKNNINLMDNTQTIDELQQIAYACEELLTTLFAVDHLRDIDHLDTYLDTFYDCSLKEIIQLHRHKKEDQTIRIQLENLNMKEITTELITLIKTEYHYLQYTKNKTALGENYNNDFANQLLAIKKQLLSTVHFSQDDLNELLAHIQLT